MIFDSEAQKQRVIKLVGEAPVHTDIAGILLGPSPELVKLMQDLHSAIVMDPEQLAEALIYAGHREKK